MTKYENTIDCQELAADWSREARIHYRFGDYDRACFAQEEAAFYAKLACACYALVSERLSNA